MRNVMEQKQLKVFWDKYHLENMKRRALVLIGKHEFKQLIPACHCSVLTSIYDKERCPLLIECEIEFNDENYVC